ncbi:MAG: hydrolase TatD, partial [Nitrospirae bacterium]
MLIDSHCHIDDARYDADREAMIQRAQAEGVGHFVTIGCDLDTSRAAVALAQQHPFISATVGVHPHEVKRIEPNWYDKLRALAKSGRVVAYGEIGLDYHYDHSPRDVQRARFR